MAWLALMSAAFLLVERQTEIQRELNSMTTLASEVKQLDQQNREAVGRQVSQASVNEVETWAVAHGMSRPTTVKPLEGDPSAVAARPASEAKQTTVEPEGGLVASVRSLMEALFAPLSAKGR